MHAWRGAPGAATLSTLECAAPVGLCFLRQQPRRGTACTTVYVVGSY